MAEYTRHLQAGVPFLALRYNEFNRDREAEVARMLRHCGLPSDNARRTLQAFDQDSQAGSHLAREVVTERLTDSRLARLTKVMSRIHDFGDPDLKLPDIYAQRDG
jgi:hypothetical protein